MKNVNFKFVNQNFTCELKTYITSIWYKCDHFHLLCSITKHQQSITNSSHHSFTGNNDQNQSKAISLDTLVKWMLVLGYHHVKFPLKGGTHLAESELPHANEMNGKSFAVFDTPCKTVYYQFTHAKQNVSHKSDIHSSLQNCGSSVSLLLHVTLLLPRIWRWLPWLAVNLWTPGLHVTYLVRCNIRIEIRDPLGGNREHREDALRLRIFTPCWQWSHMHHHRTLSFKQLVITLYIPHNKIQLLLWPCWNQLHVYSSQVSKQKFFCRLRRH